MRDQGSSGCKTCDIPVSYLADRRHRAERQRRQQRARQGARRGADAERVDRRQRGRGADPDGDAGAVERRDRDRPLPVAELGRRRQHLDRYFRRQCQQLQPGRGRREPEDPGPYLADRRHRAERQRRQQRARQGARRGADAERVDRRQRGRGADPDGDAGAVERRDRDRPLPVAELGRRRQHLDRYFRRQCQQLQPGRGRREPEDPGPYLADRRHRAERQRRQQRARQGARRGADAERVDRRQRGRGADPDGDAGAVERRDRDRPLPVAELGRRRQHLDRYFRRQCQQLQPGRGRREPEDPGPYLADRRHRAERQRRQQRARQGARRGADAERVDRRQRGRGADPDGDAGAVERRDRDRPLPVAELGRRRQHLDRYFRRQCQQLQPGRGRREPEDPGPYLADRRHRAERQRRQQRARQGARRGADAERVDRRQRGRGADPDGDAGAVERRDRDRPLPVAELGRRRQHLDRYFRRQCQQLQPGRGRREPEDPGPYLADRRHRAERQRRQQRARQGARRGADAERVDRRQRGRGADPDGDAGAVERRDRDRPLPVAELGRRRQHLDRYFRRQCQQLQPGRGRREPEDPGPYLADRRHRAERQRRQQRARQGARRGADAERVDRRQRGRGADPDGDAGAVERRDRDRPLPEAELGRRRLHLFPTRRPPDLQLQPGRGR